MKNFAGLGPLMSHGRLGATLTVALFCGMACSEANAVSMQLTGVGSGAVMGGVYTSPYTGTVDRSTVKIYCDDFLTDVGIGQTWTANATNFTAFDGATGPLKNLKFDTSASLATQLADYETVAYLVEQIAGIDQSSSAGKTKTGELSFAIWAVFDPAALDSISGTNKTNAIADLAAARSALPSLTPDQFANIEIYTPNPLNASQEYFVDVPEPATASLAAMGMVFMMVSRRRKNA